MTERTPLESAAIALFMADYPGGAGHPDQSDTDAMMFEKYRAHYEECVRAVARSLAETLAGTSGIRAANAGADAAMNSVPEMSQHDCNVDGDMMRVGFAATLKELLG